MGKLIAGVDEAGRGPLAGAVVAAAVILPENHRIVGLADSKKISPKTREILFEQITKEAVCYAIKFVDEIIIDKINILQATLLAMQEAVLALTIIPDKVLVDGNQKPNLPSNMQVETIIKGDAKIAAISAASILAKVSRDKYMLELDEIYPQYGFAKHKAYPTKAHLLALQKYGACAIHRTSFAPVKRVLDLN